MNNFNKNKKIIVSVLILVGLVIVYFGFKENKFELKGEISKCTAGEETVFQYITDLTSYTTSYYKEDGKKVDCELDATSSTCADFFSSISECTVIYRNFKDKDAERVYEAEAKNPVKMILESQ